ncbi:30S ribosomal protein S18 [Aquifex aeolicus]|uniref:Small ribosomal subunit protein bS18 n=1 Tax=Aquifex aeolicus (strain VF5) TaxID=224324 RepID=RS18_AQUAE|nr:30S ribosomal protein S18 [Aquifex aeolicus]O66476.1 RecName: Full=Small ribosomal subunit protein bS18; AltName: Full=30S ribosomal protein S18 [Aquifex aeolicus VF5]AAC06446.1 ribosomal protein S18 [Aquifex aeolicus VF5]
MVVRAPKKKVCMYCEQKREPDYKNYEELRNFLTERGRIKDRKQTGLCAKHQRRLAVQIKRARQLGLLPYVVY